MAASKTRAQKQLDEILTKYSGREFIKTDPIQVPHRYRYREDQELTAFIAAIFSFGNVASILRTLDSLLTPLGPRPFQALRQISSGELSHWLKPHYYRFYSSHDIEFLFRRLREIIEKAPLQSLFESQWQKSSSNSYLEKLSQVRRVFLEGAPSSPGLKFMFPDPLAGAAKRLHMFMRWMVRKDEVDLGLWQFASTSELVVPLDTHVFQICRHLGLTRLKSPSLKAVLEITERLKSFDAQDPIKYDFAICRVGVLKQKKEFLTLAR